MKAVFVLFIVCSFYKLGMTQTAAEVAAYNAKQQDCIKELKVPAEEATQIQSDKMVASPSEAYKCYHNCLYKKMGLMSADDKPNSEAILKFAQLRFSKVPQDKVKSELKSCTASTSKGASACEYIYNYENCVVKALKA